MRQSSPEPAGLAGGNLPNDPIETLRRFGADFPVPNTQWRCQRRYQSRQPPCVHITASTYTFVRAVDEQPFLAIFLGSTIVLNQGATSYKGIAVYATNLVTFYEVDQPPTGQQLAGTRADRD